MRIPGVHGLHRRWNLFIVNRLLSGTRFFGLKRRLLNGIGNQIGEGTRVVGPIFCSAKLIVGENCWIGRQFAAEGNGMVTIGDNCDIAPQVTMLTGGHLIGDADRRAGEGQTYTITVGNGTWIGARATLVGGVTVGNSCVVAACACVTKDLGDNVVMGGVPAKVIRELDT